jgi:hypothetical protein
METLKPEDHDLLLRVAAMLIAHPEAGTAADRAMLIHMTTAAGIPNEIAKWVMSAAPRTQVPEIRSYMVRNWDGSSIADVLRGLEAAGESE